MTGFIYPTTSSTTYDPKSSSVGSNAPYYAMNATSTQGWAQYGSGLPGPSPSSFAPTPPTPTTTPWDGLWPMHWTTLHASDIIITATSTSSMAASTSVVESNPSVPSTATTLTLAISILTALPDQPTQQLSTAIIIPMTTTAATFQSVHSSVGDEPGRIQTRSSMPALDVADQEREDVLDLSADFYGAEQEAEAVFVSNEDQIDGDENVGAGACGKRDCYYGG
ncbi:hypothetical protein EJ07DRAFT_180275 [Lizonia empirigonia]|nr:hypothetical protein EJ07DRAFT_180275 [Lizonia empirigonia]